MLKTDEQAKNYDVEFNYIGGQYGKKYKRKDNKNS